MQWLGRLSDVLFPPLCLSCNAPVAEHHSLCGGCFGKISFLTGNCCAQCAIPLHFNMGVGSKCGACLKSPPYFDSTTAICRYETTSSKLVTGIKYSDRLHLIKSIAGMMADKAQPDIATTDLIIPVPLHFIRQWRRMSNQSALLASEIARKTKKPWRSDVIKRTHHTPPQASLTRKRRHTNVAKAFAIEDKKHKFIAGRNIMLVDDVMTTGATLNACAKALKDAGAAKVQVLVFARTVLD